MSILGIRLGHRAIQETSCNSCVETPGCVYCLQSTVSHGDSGACVCGEIYDYVSSSYVPAFCRYQDQLNSRLDCQFGVENGEVILSVVVIFAVLAFVMICWWIASRGSCSENICVSSPTPLVISKPHSPAYTPEETAPRPAYRPEETAPRSMAIPDRTESLQVCSVMATDVVLVASAPLEEPISVIPAESEIIVSPPYVV